METKIEVWQDKSSLRKTCVNIPRCIPPVPPSSMLAPHIARFCLLSCPPSIKPARAIYNIEPGGEGGDEVPCKRQMRHFDFAFHLLSKKFFCTKFSRLAFPMGTLLLQKQRMVCFYRSRFFSTFFAEQPKGAPLRLQKSAVNTQ